MTEQNVLVVTVDDETNPYEEDLKAIQTLKEGETLDQPATVRFPNESQLPDVCNERTYTLLRVIRVLRNGPCRGVYRACWASASTDRKSDTPLQSHD